MTHHSSPPPTFGELLRSYREKALLTPAQLAAKTDDITAYCINALERGKRTKPHWNTVSQLVAALHKALNLTDAERQVFVEVARAARIKKPPTDGELATTAPVLPSASPPSRSEELPQRFPSGNDLSTLPDGELVDRKREHQRLLVALDAVAHGEGRVVFLAGEPGIGKTRLAQEVTQMAVNRHFLVACGRCYQPQAHVDYFPFFDVLQTLYPLAPPTIRDAIPHRWPEVARLLPAFETRDHLSPTASSMREGQQRLFWHVTGFLQALAQQQPLALLFDDLHWADTMSLGLLAHLAHHTPHNALLLLGTYRDVEVTRHHPLKQTLSDITHDGYVEHIAVPRLSLDGTGKLMALILGAEQAPDDLAPLLHRHAEGNPFFTQELLRSLVERGDLYQQDGRWNRPTLAEIEVPETVQDLLSQRLARLDPLHQEVLHEASVLGQIFHFAELMAMNEHNEIMIDDALQAAIDARLVRETEDDTFVFTHVLIHQALEMRLTPRQRRRLHRRAGEVLERLPERERTRRIADLARHFIIAKEAGRALPYMILTGDQAIAVYAHSTAESQYMKALDLSRLINDDRSEAQVLEKLAMLHYLITGRYVQARELFRQAAKAYRSVGERESQVQMLREEARLTGRIGQAAEGLALVAPLLAALQNAPEAEDVKLSLQLVRADLYYHGGHYGDQLQAAQAAAALALTQGDSASVALATDFCGIALLMLGRWDEAVAALQEAVRLTTDVASANALWICSHALRHLFDAIEQSGDFGAAEPLISRAYELVERLDHGSQLGVCTYSRGLNAFHRGDWRMAHAYFGQTGSLLDRDNQPWLYGYVPFAHGLFASVTGDTEQGRGLLEDAIGVSERNGNLHVLRKSLCIVAEIDLLHGQAASTLKRLESAIRGHEEENDSTPLLVMIAWAQLVLGVDHQAEAYAYRSRQQAAQQHNILTIVDALRVQALIALHQEHWGEAQTALEEAIAHCDAMPYPYAQAKALYLLGQICCAKRERDQARRHYEAAFAICEHLGEGLYRPHIAHKLALM